MTYNNSIIRRAEQILHYGIGCISGEREFTMSRDGTIYVDLFEGDVTIPNYIGTIKKAFNGKVGGTTYYNELIIDPDFYKTLCTTNRVVTLDLDWGSDCFLAEIDGLLSYLSGDTLDMDNAGISSKKIEDFSISFKGSDETSNDKNRIISEQFSFYIRQPLIIDVSERQRHDERYF